MSGNEWLKKQFDDVKREFESWPEWKKSSIEEDNNNNNEQEKNTVACEAQNEDSD